MSLHSPIPGGMARHVSSVANPIYFLGPKLIPVPPWLAPSPPPSIPGPSPVPPPLSRCPLPHLSRCALVTEHAGHTQGGDGWKVSVNMYSQREGAIRGARPPATCPPSPPHLTLPHFPSPHTAAHRIPLLKERGGGEMDPDGTSGRGTSIHHSHAHPVSVARPLPLSIHLHLNTPTTPPVPRPMHTHARLSMKRPSPLTSTCHKDVSQGRVTVAQAPHGEWPSRTGPPTDCLMLASHKNERLL